MSTKPSRNCILCDRVLDESSDSPEHIIPDCIGGRKIVWGFICRACNHGTGSTWDAEVARQTHSLCLLFSIKRTRGPIRPRTLSSTHGEAVRYNHDGSMAPAKPEFDIRQQEDQLRIEMTTPSRRSARKHLKALAKKYPQIDVEKVMASAVSSYKPVSGSLRFDFPECGPAFWRALIKSVLALIAHAGGEPAACAEGMSFLRKEDIEPCIGFFYERDLVQNRPDGVPFHLICVQSSGKGGPLFAYVELFGYLRVVAAVSESYDGPPLRASYAIDPRNGLELKLEVNLSITLRDVHDAYKYKKINTDAMRAAIEAVVGPAVKAANVLATSRVAKRLVGEALQKVDLKDGDHPTPKQIADFERHLAESITAWIQQQEASESDDELRGEEE